MKLTKEQLTKTFTVVANKETSLIELNFVSEDVGMENIDLQSDLIVQAIKDVFIKDPLKTDWTVLVDTATTGVSSMSKYSRNNYKELIKIPSSKKIALLIADADKQNLVAQFVLNIFTKTSKKMNIFSSKEEAMLWLKS
jgi:hypothetical protein